MIMFYEHQMATSRYFIFTLLINAFLLEFRKVVRACTMRRAVLSLLNPIYSRFPSDTIHPLLFYFVVTSYLESFIYSSLRSSRYLSSYIL